MQPVVTQRVCAHARKYAQQSVRLFLPFGTGTVAARHTSDRSGSPRSRYTDANLPIQDAMHDLCSTDPNQETCCYIIGRL